MLPSVDPTYVVEDRKEERQKQISQRKSRDKKRYLIRIRHSRKMAQENR
ncbi:MAG: hypothetical protein ACMUEL_01560 [Flavobacteriales bacterium Tduv]